MARIQEVVGSNPISSTTKNEAKGLEPSWVGPFVYVTFSDKLIQTIYILYAFWAIRRIYYIDIMIVS